jgi:hypothetical protein
MTLLIRAVKLYIFAKPVMMVDPESLSTARLMMKLKFIRKQSVVSKIHHKMTQMTTARILGQAVHKIPPTTC